jgi:alcohol dehydrogenase
VRVVFGAGTLADVGALARAEGATHVLLVCDDGVTRAGYVERAVASLREHELPVSVFDKVHENPTTDDVDRGLIAARENPIDFIVALGGGSVMDCAKGINLLLTNGGSIADYWGINKAEKPMLPLIAVPTTAGTGSEAQSFALISDAATHRKMACGDRRPPAEGGLRPRAAILDPRLTRTQPAAVAAATGLDALAHAIETAGCTARNDVSITFSREAWSRLSVSFAPAIANPADESARANMLLGAHLAGCAIEHSMLGAAHACANPLTAHFGMVHGVAVALMLPHVIRFNIEQGTNPYATITDGGDAGVLIASIENCAAVGQIPRTLGALHIDAAALPMLAEEAARQWTASYNPRPVTVADCLDLYRRAW